MLSAFKMEAHDHPDWSGSSYYGETEVCALGCGYMWRKSRCFWRIDQLLIRDLIRGDIRNIY